MELLQTLILLIIRLFILLSFHWSRAGNNNPSIKQWLYIYIVGALCNLPWAKHVLYWAQSIKKKSLAKPLKNSIWFCFNVTAGSCENYWKLRKMKFIFDVVNDTLQTSYKIFIFFCLENVDLCFRCFMFFAVKKMDDFLGPVEGVWELLRPDIQ